MINPKEIKEYPQDPNDKNLYFNRFNGLEKLGRIIGGFAIEESTNPKELAEALNDYIQLSEKGETVFGWREKHYSLALDIARKFCKPGDTFPNYENDPIRGMKALYHWCKNKPIREKNNIVLDDEEMTLLCELGGNPLTTHSQVIIATATDIPIRTIGRKLKSLESRNLVYRPKGPRKGYSITKDGEQFIKKASQ